MSQANQSITILELVKFIIPIISTFLAGFFGLLYGLKQVKVQKRLSFIEKQLNEFYSPLLGCRTEILCKSKVRLKIELAANESWKELCERKDKRGLDDFDVDKAYEPYGKIIEYNNNQLRQDLLPKYRNMLSIFTENYWLAQSDTRKWYSELCEFIEIWDRCMSDSLPNDVVRKLEHHENKLNSFYEDLEKQIDFLRKELVNR